ncbi:hypothetical protein KBK19_10040 [Microvirga sp. STR05]|uniref:Uncharacterized protein n=1 Tax=Hymenobacter duratus TaxID=2771356 RepID=A0ABR8JJ20_9BACT|nr:hypothetical protein [Hymenobacter duratus]MBD2715375.1 hypothetical protein [Hymenobacter duratus]MBR7950282.1 hypothetical protein [Microvirga sp. STR05]
MLPEHNFEALRLELSAKAKNGLDFIGAATLVWAAIAFVWTLPVSVPSKGFITFCVGAAVLPLAALLSRVLGTTWKLPHNPLQPLGLWLNFAQLFYFPFLIFMLMRYPQHFIMTYGIITGAHFFPYAWFYRAWPYACMAGLIPVGCLVLGLQLSPPDLYLIPAFVAGALLVLGGLLLGSYRRNRQAYLLTSPAGR